ncbi:hypothetical protein C0J52_02696 [Blattella germanica]|nr:hypothetical protein C0J52_02696 [Blattella germanica]
MDNLIPETDYIQLWDNPLLLNVDLLGNLQVDNLENPEITIPFGEQHIEEESVLNVAEASPTGKHPSTDDFPGKYNFNIALGGNRSGSIWNYSPDLGKLFIKMNNKIQIGFIYDTPEKGRLYLRALPVFLDSINFAKPVERCYQHRNPEDMINKDNVQNANHLIWIHGDDAAQYMFDETSKRLSVRTFLGPKASGSDRVYKEFSFMCLNSCQRIKCPIAIIFTLEDEK